MKNILIDKAEYDHIRTKADKWDELSSRMEADLRDETGNEIVYENDEYLFEALVDVGRFTAEAFGYKMQSDDTYDDLIGKRPE